MSWNSTWMPEESCSHKGNIVSGVGWRSLNSLNWLCPFKLGQLSCDTCFALHLSSFNHQFQFLMVGPGFSVTLSCFCTMNCLNSATKKTNRFLHVMLQIITVGLFPCIKLSQLLLSGNKSESLICRNDLWLVSLITLGNNTAATEIAHLTPQSFFTAYHLGYN